MNKYQKGWRPYDPKREESYALSRSKIDLFLECPRCFYLDRRLWVKRPGWPAFTLNSAVDALLKNEFDLLRQNGEQHELMKKYQIDALPYQHAQLDEWRHNFVGARTIHQPTNLEIYGAVDDLWITPDKKLVVVDYKSTSTKKEIDLDDKYKKTFKKQAEVYQWIFKQKGFDVSDTAYFVYANAGRNRPKFDGRLEFEMSIIPYEGDSSWVEDTVFAIKECLDSNEIPAPDSECEYCQYREQAGEALSDQPLKLL